MRPRSVSPFSSTLGATIAINVRLAIASLLAWLAYVAWPGPRDWWGFWLLSGFAGLAATSLAGDAIR